jgi:aromatic ring-opening dioxygenase catalytic subunit (LigB family)
MLRKSLMKDTKLPTLFIPHGGGPWPFTPPSPGQTDIWEKLGAYLRSIPAALPAPLKAILVVSGHWETSRPTVNVNPAPPLLFDYYNFPHLSADLSGPRRAGTGRACASTARCGGHRLGRGA